MKKLGWKELDVLLISGDAYIDHPSFGTALLGRLLVAHGYRTGVIAQPRWDSPDDISRMGRPRLYAGVTAGAIDSMLAHYTAFRKKRSDDAYTPGGQSGARPNRASIVYANLVRQAFPGLPVVLGGIEASLRRASHYDFWTSKLRRSILFDAKADLVVYGMGEHATLEIAQKLDASPGEVPFGVRGTAFISKRDEAIPPDADIAVLPSHEDILADPRKLMQATLAMEQQVQSGSAWARQSAGGRDVIIAPPAPQLSTDEMDTLYALPFARQPHPGYTKPIPAFDMIRDSITSHRGCGGGCSFCSLALHQGRRIRSRSRNSILAEAERIASAPGFKGAISDVGGPSANMWGAKCTADSSRCKRTSCMVPAICPNFRVDHAANLELLRAVRNTNGIKHVRVASGVRFDLALQDEKTLSRYLGEFVGGQLKIAPEHLCPHVLKLMRKPGMEPFEKFLTVFKRESARAGKEQYVIPYLMSGFPGTTDKDMETVSAWLKQRGWRPQQVQCFIPTPGTVATAMFHAGIDPKGNPIHVAKSDAERLRQHHILIPTHGRPPQKGRKNQCSEERRSQAQKTNSKPRQAKRSRGLPEGKTGKAFRGK